MIHKQLQASLYILKKHKSQSSFKQLFCFQTEKSLSAEGLFKYNPYHECVLIMYFCNEPVVQTYV